MGVQYGFGSGRLFGIRSDVSGSTPVQFGTLQDVTIDFDYELREVYGQNQLPIDILRGRSKITGKAKFAQLSPLMLNSLFFGQTLAGGEKLAATNELHLSTAVPSCVTTAATTSGNQLHFAADSLQPGLSIGSLVRDATRSGVIPYGTYLTGALFGVDTVFLSNSVTGGGVQSGDTIQFSPYVVPSYISTFDTDLGVTYASSGQPLVYVTGEPDPGEYCVGNNFLYQFNPADANTQVLINYTYTSSAGSNIQGMTQPLGTTPKFMAVFEQIFNGNSIVLKLFSCVSSKLSMPTKIDDYILMEFDFSALPNSSGSAFELSTTSL